MSHQVDHLQIVISRQGIDQEESAPGTAPMALLASSSSSKGQQTTQTVNCSSSRPPGKLRAPNAHRPVILGLAVLTATDSRIRIKGATRREMSLRSIFSSCMYLGMGTERGPSSLIRDTFFSSVKQWLTYQALENF